MNDYRAYPDRVFPAQTQGVQGTGVAFGATGYIKCDTPAIQPRFEAIADRLANLPSQAHTAMQRLRSLADRYGGPIPEAVASKDAMPPQNSVAGRLEGSTESLDTLLSQIHAQIDRLERF